MIEGIDDGLNDVSTLVRLEQMPGSFVNAWRAGEPRSFIDYHVCWQGWCSSPAHPQSTFGIDGSDNTFSRSLMIGSCRVELRGVLC